MADEVAKSVEALLGKLVEKMGSIDSTVNAVRVNQDGIAKRLTALEKEYEESKKEEDEEKEEAPVAKAKPVAKEVPPKDGTEKVTLPLDPSEEENLNKPSKDGATKGDKDYTSGGLVAKSDLDRIVAEAVAKAVIETNAKLAKENEEKLVKSLEERLPALVKAHTPVPVGYNPDLSADEVRMISDPFNAKTGIIAKAIHDERTALGYYMHGGEDQIGWKTIKGDEDGNLKFKSAAFLAKMF